MPIIPSAFNGGPSLIRKIRLRKTDNPMGWMEEHEKEMKHFRPNMNFRIVRYYHPSAGTWYVIQRKRFLFWKNLPLVFPTEERASTELDFSLEHGDREIYKTPVKTVLLQT